MNTNADVDTKVEPEDKKKTWIDRLIAIGIFCIVLGAWWFTPKFVSMMGAGSDYSKAGQFGDQFGFINALFSALAVFMLILTMRLQINELRIQRKEFRNNVQALNDQKHELKRTADIQELANKIQILKLKLDSDLAAHAYLSKDSNLRMLNSNKIQSTEAALNALETTISTIYDMTFNTLK